MIEESDVSFNASVDHVFLGAEGPVPITEVFPGCCHTPAPLRFVLWFHDVVDAALNLSSLPLECKKVVVIRLMKVFSFKLPFES